MRALAVVVVATIMTVGCGSDSPTTPTPTPSPTATFSQVQTRVFNVSCVVHHGATPSQGLDLRSPQSFANLVNVPSTQTGTPLVAPGNADGSYLVQKLENAPGIAGEQMPRTGQPIGADLMQLVRDWVNAGAQNN